MKGLPRRTVSDGDIMASLLVTQTSVASGSGSTQDISTPEVPTTDSSPTDQSPSAPDSTAPPPAESSETSDPTTSSRTPSSIWDPSSSWTLRNFANVSSETPSSPSGSLADFYDDVDVTPRSSYLVLQGRLSLSRREE